MTKTSSVDALIEAVVDDQEYLEREIQDAFGGYRGSPISIDAIKSYQGSLDAAKSLHDALLPGWFLGVSQNIHCGHWYAWVQDKSTLHFSATKHDPARALLICILKAYRSIQTQVE